MIYTQGKKKRQYKQTERAHILDLVDKDSKAPIINVFKKLKENITTTQQIDNLNSEIKIINKLKINYKVVNNLKMKKNHQLGLAAGFRWQKGELVNSKIEQ